MPDLWYCARGDGYIGPLTGHELLEKLASSATAKDMFVWCDRLPDWKRVGDVEELGHNSGSLRRYRHGR